MTDEKKKRGPKPDVFKVTLPFEEAVSAALQTPAPSDKERERLLSDAYAALHADLSRAMYRADPLGVGPEAPDDEYDMEASRVAARLRQTNGDARSALRGVLDYTGESLVRDVESAWEAFTKRIAR